MRRFDVVVGIVVLALGGGVATPSDAQWACVKCTFEDDCDADVGASACSCTIRVRQNGSVICRENGYCSNADCEDHITSGSQSLRLDQATLDAIGKQDEMLGILFEASIVTNDEAHSWYLNGSDYGNGTLRLPGNQRFVHRGSFDRAQDGAITFRFQVTPEVEDGSGFEYVGRLVGLPGSGVALTGRKLTKLPGAIVSEKESIAFDVVLPSAALLAAEAQR